MSKNDYTFLARLSIMLFDQPIFAPHCKQKRASLGNNLLQDGQKYVSSYSRLDSLFCRFVRNKKKKRKKVSKAIATPIKMSKNQGINMVTIINVHAPIKLLPRYEIIAI